jgi:hypothetical protein
MPIHDYKCKECNVVHHDVWGEPEVTCCHAPNLQIFFGLWDTVTLKNDGHCLDERTDRKGFVQRFSVRDDGLCKQELSRFNDGKGLKSFTPEQSEHYRNKLAKDGDSSNLRREILKQRNNNLGSTKSAAWEG